MNEQIKTLVKSFRDKARAVLRLQAINLVVDRIQGVQSALKKVQDMQALNNKRLEDIDSGNYALDIQNAQNTRKSPEEIRADVIASITANNASLAKQEEDLKKELENLETEITNTANGSKGYAFSRNEITSLSNKLIREASNELSLSDISEENQESEDKLS